MQSSRKHIQGNRITLIQEETASASWRHMTSQSNPADFISRGIETITLSTSTLWWNGPQWLSQEPSSWPTTKTNTPKDNLEIRNVYIACLQSPEDITQRFSKLNTHQINWLLQEIHKQLQKSQGQQEINYHFHTRS